MAGFEVPGDTMGTPVPPKNILPREPTFREGAWDTVKTLGPWAFFGYALGGGLAGKEKRSRHSQMEVAGES